MKQVIIIPFIFLGAIPVAARDDLPLYLDAGCPGTGVPRSVAQGPASMGIATVNSTKIIPVTCDDKASGTDAAVLHNTKKVAAGLLLSGEPFPLTTASIRGIYLLIVDAGYQVFRTSFIYAM